MNDPVSKHVYTDWVNEYKDVKMPPPGPATTDFIFRMKSVKDYEYANYVTNLRRGTSWGEFGSDSVKIILDSLVALTGTAATKSALGAASAGVTGATASIKKNVLFDQSITTFINKMDTLRLQKWNQILLKWKGAPGEGRPAQAYTAAEAFDDLQEYGRFGTLDSALRDVAAKTSEEQNKAEAVNDTLKNIPKTEQLLKKDGE